MRKRIYNREYMRRKRAEEKRVHCDLCDSWMMEEHYPRHCRDFSHTHKVEMQKLHEKHERQRLREERREEKEEKRRLREEKKKEKEEKKKEKEVKTITI